MDKLFIFSNLNIKKRKILVMSDHDSSNSSNTGQYFVLIIVALIVGVFIFNTVGSLANKEEVHDDGHTSHAVVPEKNTVVHKEPAVVKAVKVVPVAPNKDTQLLKELKANYSRLELALAQSKQELSQSKQQLSQSKQQLQSSQNNLNETQAKLANSQKELLTANAQIAKFKSDFSQSKSALEQSKEKLGRALGSIGDLETTLNKQITATNKAEKELKITKVQRDHTIQEAEALRSDLVVVKKDLEITDSKMKVIGRLIEADDVLSK